MHTIALVSQKGGSGKTTLAINLAIAAEMAGNHVALIDLDPQASAAGWGDHRGRGRPAVVAIPATRLDEALRAARGHGADIAILDTAPHAESAALSAVRAADLALVPLRPGILDLRALRATADICRLARKEGVVVLNHVPPRGPLADQAAAALGVYGLRAAPCRVGARVAFVHSLTSGKGVLEHDPQGKAATETRDLFDWVWGRLERESGKHAEQGKDLVK